MRRVLFCFLLSFMLSHVEAAATGESPKDAKIECVRTLLKLLIDERFADFVAASDATMKSVLPEGKLKEVWDSVIKDFGPFQSELRATSQALGEAVIVDMVCRFQRGTLNIRISLNQKDEAAGLFFTPSSEGVAYVAPAYVDKNEFTEIEVTVSAGKFPLPGTLTLPKGGDRVPAVVLVHGSGPQDRDATIFENKPLKDLAWGLASKGVAVLRYEKRTKAFGHAMNPDHITLEDEVMDDAVAAAKLLRAHERIDPARVFVAGHSLGACTAPSIALAEPGVRGIIMLGAAARPIYELVEDQVKYIARADGVVDDRERAEIDEIVKVVDVLRQGKASPGATLLGAPAAYWNELDRLDPVGKAKSLKIPILIVQGGRDYQVSTEKDFSIWKRELSDHKNVSLLLLDNLDHLLRAGQGPSTPAQYQVRGSVDQSAIDAIVEWIKKN